MKQPQKNRFTDAEMDIAREIDLLESLGYLVVAKSASFRSRLKARTECAPLLLLFPPNPLR